MPKRERSPSPTGGLTKGPWTPEEDEALVQYVREHGEGNWNRVGRQTGIPRSGKSCRLRWLNHLRPDLKKGSFSNEEERLVVHLHARFGNKWSLMAAHLPGRTDNDIKNFWNTRAKRYESAGWPLYANPNAARAPIVPQTTSLPAQRLDFPGNVPTPLSFVQHNGNAALAYGREGTPALPQISSSVTSDLPRFIQHADQSSKMIAVPGFSALHGADLEANRHLPSGTHYLPAYGPGATMPELPSGQHLQTGQSSRGKASPLPLHQTVDTERHQQLLAAENALLQRIGLPQAILHAPETSKTTTEGSDPQCNQIRSEGQSAWPAFNEQVPDSSGSSLTSNSNPEADNVTAQSNEDGQISRRTDVTRPDALLGLCQFFA